MIYQDLPESEPVSQGDIIDECRLLRWEDGTTETSTIAKEIQSRVIVITQACDAALAKTTRIVVAAVHNAGELVDAGILKAQTIRDRRRSVRILVGLGRNRWLLFDGGRQVPPQLRVVTTRDVQYGVFGHVSAARWALLLLGHHTNFSISRAGGLE